MKQEKLNIEIIRLAHSDLDELCLFAKTTFVAAYFHLLKTDSEVRNFNSYVARAFSVNQIKTEVENPLSAFFGIKQADEIIAYLKVNQGLAHSIEGREDGLEVERLYIHLRNKKMGFGSHLLHFADELSSELKLNKIWLRTWERNLKAIPFYEKHGFKIVDKMDFKFEGGDDVDFILEKILK